MGGIGSAQMTELQVFSFWCCAGGLYYFSLVREDCLFSLLCSNKLLNLKSDLLLCDQISPLVMSKRGNKWCTPIWFTRVPKQFTNRTEYEASQQVFYQPFQCIHKAKSDLSIYQGYHDHIIGSFYQHRGTNNGCLVNTFGTFKVHKFAPISNKFHIHPKPGK